MIFPLTKEALENFLNSSLWASRILISFPNIMGLTIPFETIILFLLCMKSLGHEGLALSCFAQDIKTPC